MSADEATPRPWRVGKAKDDPDDPMHLEEPFVSSDYFVAGPQKPVEPPESSDPLEVESAFLPLPVAWINNLRSHEELEHGTGTGDDEWPKANAEMIVHRVNAHEGLVAVLEHIAETAERRMKQPRPDQETLTALWQDTAQVARDAIEQAEKEKPTD